MTEPNAPAIDPVNEAAYVVDQRRPHWPATIDGLIAASAEVANHPGFTGDLAYGSHPREALDWYATAGEVRGLVAYFHPGYWQMRDRTLVRCLMPVFAGLGFDVATVGYPLCPDASLASLTGSARAAVPALLAHGRRVRGRDLPIVAAGHSAGGHLAVELAVTDWAARGLAPSPIAGVVALSGVYDVEPLVSTSLNVALRLDAASARAASPVHRVPAGAPPALFAVGGAETAAFLAQNRAMAEAWRAAGNAAHTLESPGDDHFTLILQLMDEASPVHRAVADLLAEAVPPSAGG
jgi:arylformamidase